MKAEGGGPIHFTTSHQFAQASHRTADASSDLSNCPTQSTRSATVLLRKRRSTVARRITDIPALDRPREEGERGGSRDVGAVNVGAEDVPSGQFQTFCRTHERPTSEEGCAALLMAIDVAPSTRLQHARVLRSMLQMHRIPLEMLLLVLQKIAAGSETKQARPSTKEEMNQFVRSRTDWKQRVVFDLRGSLARSATSTRCQGLVLFAREEAKRHVRRSGGRRKNGSEGTRWSHSRGRPRSDIFIRCRIPSALISAVRAVCVPYVTRNGKSYCLAETLSRTQAP
ncbi:hypothetical protein MOQ_003993 [Trypanosoma cruzi marinkellei]|uniref:Uncharacterized protein n=1 Tax=Trypanosoma cruzi marinkellei TaxID=85056 RepID=K2NTB3_TRYCR|nr:hypothetical protein MOQ_003993 [Trypanosoma cruzi marinkellei]